ncbi:hypothetical protein BESB_001780 [Besnoitia besnoiti]|uniref:Dymeclin n=1 Tax=Besnoitia besnoiti TaxID=94643 RepID=A0A2A9MNM3_BESBE|nr:hypothetical protein BESB_001780 [Besnoitia besnoiti]PFH37836.1 hypothetical protein BESB_001780 [Besnoitia besnoiti]
MGSSSSRVAGADEARQPLGGAGEATRQVEALVSAVQRLAASSPGGLSEGRSACLASEAIFASADALGVASRCPSPSSRASVEGALPQWEDLLLSLGEGAVRTAALSTPFLWNELLLPLLQGNAHNGQLKALFLFFARTLFRYGEAVESVHRRCQSAASPAADSESEQPPADSAPFPCSDLSLAELALLLRILTKALCSRLSLPQILYHLEYAEAASADVTATSLRVQEELLSLATAFSAAYVSKRQRSSASYAHAPGEDARDSVALPNGLSLPSADAESLDSASPIPDAKGGAAEGHGETPRRLSLQTSSLSSKRQTRESLDLSDDDSTSDAAPSPPTALHGSVLSGSARASSSASSLSSHSPSVGAIDSTATPATTATVDSCSSSEASKKAARGFRPEDASGQAASPVAGGAAGASPTFCAFLLSYRGESKVLSASPLRSPEQLHADVLTWLAEAFPEDAVAARARGFLFRTTARGAATSPRRAAQEGEACASAEGSREVFLSVNDLASVRTLGAVLTPVRLNRQKERAEGGGNANKACGGRCECRSPPPTEEPRAKTGDVPDEAGRGGASEGDSAAYAMEPESEARAARGVPDGADMCTVRERSCASASTEGVALTSKASAKVLVAELTLIPLWIPLSPESSASRAASPAASPSPSAVGSLLDAIVKFLTVAQPPSPCCSPHLMRAHQHLLELLLALFAVVCPLQLTASCLPRRPLPSPHRKRPLRPPVAADEAHAASECDGEANACAGAPSQLPQGGNAPRGLPRAHALGREGGMRSREEGEEAGQRNEGAFSTNRPLFDGLLIPPLRSPHAKLAPALYVWQQEAQRQRYRRCMYTAAAERGGSLAADLEVAGGRPFLPVAAASLLPDLCFMEIMLSRWEQDKRRGETRAKEFAAYLLSMMWPSSALLAPASASAPPSFVSVPPALAHCALSAVLLLTFYPHPRTRMSLLLARLPPRRLFGAKHQPLDAGASGTDLSLANSLWSPSFAPSAAKPAPPPLHASEACASPLAPSPSSFSHARVYSAVFEEAGFLPRRASTPEANVFALAFSALYDASHFSSDKKTGHAQHAGGLRSPGDSTEALSLALPPLASLNFDGLLLQLCSPSSLSHPLKSLLLYLLLCRNRCFRLFCLSRSDGERLVIPLLQLLNALSRFSPEQTPREKEDGRRSSPMGAAPPLAIICAISLMTLTKDKSFCQELQKKVVGQLPWDEKKKVVADASLGSLVVLVLLRVISWNIRRCGDVFFLLLCSSCLLNVASSVEQLHWYVADRLADCAAGLLRQFARRLSSLSAAFPTGEDALGRVEGGGEAALCSARAEKDEAASREAFAQKTQTRRETRARNSSRFLSEFDGLELLLLACRSVVQFLAVALRPPLLSRNLPLLYAVLRLFPTSTAKELLNRFADAWRSLGASRHLPSADAEGACERRLACASFSSHASTLSLASPGERGEAAARAKAEGEVAAQMPRTSMSETHRLVATRVSLLLGNELRLLVDLVQLFTASIEDAFREGTAVEEDGETSRRVVEQVAAKIPPPSRDRSFYPLQQMPVFLYRSENESEEESQTSQGEEGRKRQMERLRESFLACGAPEQLNFTESWESSAFFFPLVWRSIDALFPDRVCWDRAAAPATVF